MNSILTCFSKNLKFKEAKVGMVLNSRNFGKFKITDVSHGFKKVSIEFLETKFQTTARWDSIAKGAVRDMLKPTVKGVGFLGEGKYVNCVKRKRKREYTTWVNMLDRCYGELRLKSNPSYIGCTVCKEWHNYQNFAAWYEVNYPNDGGEYHLDKDIKVEGNRVYSPSTCIFVTQKDNAEKAAAKYYKMKSPEGACVEIYNMVEFCKDNELIDSLMTKVHSGERHSHKGWTKYVE